MTHDEREEDYVSHTDDDIRALCTSGDMDQAASLAVRKYGAEVLGYLRSLHSHADAADVFSIVIERLWRRFRTFQWNCSLRTWLYILARGESLRFHKNTFARRRHLGSVSEADEVPEVVRTETESILCTENRGRLRALRDELPREDREILVLRVDRDMSWADIAVTFLDNPDAGADAVHREAARLRKRFQAVKERLVTRGREVGLIPPRVDA